MKLQKANNTLLQVEENVAAPPQTPNLAVSVSASFPQAEIFGVKLVNKHATQALLEFTNSEKEPVQIAFVSGALSALQPLAPRADATSAIVRNLSSTRYDYELPAGEKASIPYTFTTDLHPNDLRLNLVAVVVDKAGSPYQIQAYNETVTVVDAATSIFDPQM